MRRHLTFAVALVARRQAVFQHHHVADIVGDAARHGGRDDAVMAVEEDRGHDTLQDDHRRHDDDQRAAEQPARHDALDDAERVQQGADRPSAKARPRCGVALSDAVWDKDIAGTAYGLDVERNFGSSSILRRSRVTCTSTERSSWRFSFWHSARG